MSAPSRKLVAVHVSARDKVESGVAVSIVSVISVVGKALSKRGYVWLSLHVSGCGTASRLGSRCQNLGVMIVAPPA